uniref:hypothetical protein n=1 Tax=Amycolatopsis sp. CA-096443 TaxID=3239919 RepID=UPI003F49402D
MPDGIAADRHHPGSTNRRTVDWGCLDTLLAQGLRSGQNLGSRLPYGDVSPGEKPCSEQRGAVHVKTAASLCEPIRPDHPGILLAGGVVLFVAMCWLLLRLLNRTKPVPEGKEPVAGLHARLAHDIQARIRAAHLSDFRHAAERTAALRDRETTEPVPEVEATTEIPVPAPRDRPHASPCTRDGASR